MAQTQIINSISRTDTFPVEVAISASSNCGMLLLVLNGDWSDQMVYELPALNVTIYLDDTTILKSFNINMRTVFADCKPTEPYCIPIYDIPEQCIVKVLPIFDNNALASHNEMLADGIVNSIETTDGIVGSDVVQKWDTITTTFDLSLIFDDSNVKAGGEGGSGQPVSAADVTFDTSGTSLTSTNVQDAIEEVQTNMDNLPEPMIFKGSLGTGGTITTLPEATETNKGFTYKVITAGTYQGVAAEVGDTLISDGTAWILIPSGDEPSGTVTNVAVTSADGSATITGSPITSSGIIDISVVTDDAFDANSTKPVQNATLTELFTPITQQQYDSLISKDQPLYFIYEL